jgi:hypothetical protein
MNRNGLEFSFAWIFAIIAGAAILFSALYLASNLIKSGTTERDTLVAGELANLISPIETNLEDSRYSVIEFAEDTRLYNECSLDGPFGVQRLSTASRSSSKKEWSKQSVRKSVYNKYIFSRSIEETNGDRLHVLVNPLSAPFKIGDLVTVYGKEYCLVNPTNNIEEIILDLSSNGEQNIGINISSSLSSCKNDSTKVCFNSLGCEVNVNTQAKFVAKEGREIYYEGDTLQLAAILSDPLIYECQLKRLMKRANELAIIYSKKSLYVEGMGCSNNLVGDLQAYASSTNIGSSRDYRVVAALADDLSRRNSELAACKIF